MFLWPFRRPPEAPPPPMLYEPRYVHTIHVHSKQLSWHECITHAAPDTHEHSRTWRFGGQFSCPAIASGHEIAVHFAWFAPYLTMTRLLAVASMKKYRPDLAPASPYVLAWSRAQFPTLIARFKDTQHFVNGLGLVATESTKAGICMGAWLGANRNPPTARMHQCDRFSTFEHSTLFAFVDREGET